MTKKKQTPIIIGILVVLTFIFLANNFGLFSITAFEFGFLPYGESPNQITDFFIESSSCSTNSCTVQATSKFWDINVGNAIRSGNLPTFGIRGDDFNLIQEGAGCDANGKNCYVTSFEFITTEEFSERDFKTKFICNPSGNGQTGFGSCGVSVSFKTATQIISIPFPGFIPNAPSQSHNILIRPSVISDNVDVWWDGEKIYSADIVGDYKIKIDSALSVGGSGTSGTFIMENPSFKQQFGCTKEPGEQFYVAIFNEGDRLNLNKLDNFNKFCLEEAPLKIFSNVGSTTNVEVLGGLVNGEEFIVPVGQIWSVEYIGDLTNFVTQCEENELFNINENVCLARTVVTLICPEGSEFSFSRGICVVETQPTLFNPSTIETHQELQREGMLRFTHILQDRMSITSNSINFFGDSFSSNGVIYTGSQSGNINFPEDEANWFVDFSFGGISNTGQLGDNFILDDRLSVEITDMGGFRDKDILLVTDFKVEYTFTIDVNFLDTSYADGKITVTNNFKSTDGGIVLTKTNNIGTTTIESIDRTLNLGDTVFDIDTNNLVQLKVRPFINIDTPQFDYKFDSRTAITITDFEQPVLPTPEPEPTSNLGLILGIGILGGLVVFIFSRVRKGRR